MFARFLKSAALMINGAGDGDPKRNEKYGASSSLETGLCYDEGPR